MSCRPIPIARTIIMSVWLLPATANAADISLWPVGNDKDGSLDPHVEIKGNEIIMPGEGGRIFLEVRLANWDPDLDGSPLLKRWQAKIDSSGFTSGLRGTLTLASVPCAGDAECVTALGPGATCSLASSECTAGFMDTGRGDFVLAGTDHLSAVTRDTPDFEYEGVVQSPPFAADPGQTTYGGTLVLDVPTDAGGTFTVGFRSNPDSLMLDANDDPIPITLTPALITIQLGQCCSNLPASICTDEVTRAECSTQQPPFVFIPGGSCFGLPCCPICTEDSFCDDRDLCTDDICGFSVELCGCVSTPRASSPPQLLQIEESIGGDLVDLTSNRTIGFVVGDPSQSQYIRIRFMSLPEPFDTWNGTDLFVTEPRDICSLPGVADAEGCGAAPTFKVAGLTCDSSQAFATRWDLLGPVYVQHPGLVPGGRYDVQAIYAGCDPDGEANYSPPLAVQTSAFGDISGAFDPDTPQWLAPDGDVGIPTDVVAAIDAFGNKPGNVTKLRADLEPCVLDFKINIIDIVHLLDAFRGLPYPFVPGLGDCPSDPCGG